MSSTQPPDARLAELETALLPVGRALLDEASRDAARLVAEARGTAAGAADRAERDTGEMLQAARLRGAASARVRDEIESARERHQAAHSVLTARADARRRVQVAVVEAVDRLRLDPRYPTLLDRLEQVALEQLGPGTVIQRDPGGKGGIVATVPGRRVDYTLAALAERALEALGDEATELWGS